MKNKSIIAISAGITAAVAIGVGIYLALKSKRKVTAM